MNGAVKVKNEETTVSWKAPRQARDTSNSFFYEPAEISPFFEWVFRRYQVAVKVSVNVAVGVKVG